jgi:hypothetical protein
MKTVQEHLAVKTNQRDLAWIKTALQSAIALEHSTLPLYLSSMFSLQVQNYTSYNLIRGIVMEEMVHMAIACNMLAILGGSPQIKSLDPGFPRKGLPGNAEPDVTAVIAKLSKRQLKNFLRIETPALLLDDKYKKEAYPTIGKLYAAIRQAIQDNSKEVAAAMKKGGPAGQVGDDIGFTTFSYPAKGSPIPQLLAGIDQIVEQGEGNSLQSLFAGSGSQDEASHYMRFAEIFFGATYSKPPAKTKLSIKTLPEFFKGVPISFPGVTNTLMVPKDSYAAILKKDPNAKKVLTDLVNFDNVYTGIMNDLDAMWNGLPGNEWPTFGDAVAKMTDMRVLSVFYIMDRHVIPANIIKELPKLYPDEYKEMAAYTDLKKPVSYGPRFMNMNIKG